MSEHNEKYVNGLRALADLASEHSEVTSYGHTLNLFVQSLVEMTALARKIGGRWTKTSLGDYLILRRDLGGGVAVEIYVRHEIACERVVVGEEVVEREVPDPDRVALLPKVKVTETVEKVEWRCPPSFLAGEAVES